MVAEQKPRGGWSAPASTVARIRDDAPTFCSEFEKSGFAIVKGIFSLDEALEMRRRCAEVFTATNGKFGDLATHALLRDILLDDRVLAVARAVLGPEIVYFGDSTFYANSRFERHMHNDAHGDMADPARTDYPIIRMGIYLQDHAWHSNGLKVKPGSHRRVFWNARNAARMLGVGGPRLSVDAFRPCSFYNVPSEPGDLVFWSLRTHHSGHALRLRGFDTLALPPTVERYFPLRFTRPMAKERFAMFMSWARPSPVLDAYIKYIGYDRMNREYWERCRLDAPDVGASFSQKNVILRNDVLRLYQFGA
jgi:hypothetical protein